MAERVKFNVHIYAMKNSESKIGARTGPKPETLKLKGEWQALVGKALAKKRPARGWPKTKKK